MPRRPDRVVLLVAAALSFAAGAVLPACAAGGPPTRFRGHVFERGPERFRVGPLDPRWERLEAPAGDLAWFDPQSKSIIAANAVCEGHKDPPLVVLLNDVLLGVTHRHYLLEERVRLDGREALHAVVAAELDGVPRVFDVYVLKKDGCVYDLWLVTPPAAYERVADEFVAFVTGFRALGRAT